MIVCVCKAINDRAIRRAVAEGHDTFDAIQFELGVGTNCGKCVASACEVVFEARIEALERRAEDAVAAATAASTVFPLRFVERPAIREIALA